MMITSSWKRLCSASALMMLLLGAAQAADSDKPPFYEFSHAGKTVYLLGSIHVGMENFYPLPRPVEQAFERSEMLVVEADVGGAPAEIQRLLQKYGMKRATPDAQTAEALKSYCVPRAQICASLTPFSPWLQASQITVVQFASLGYSPESGVDVTLLERARGNKAIAELEGMEFQFRMMASLDESHQWAMVREAIEVSDEEIRQLISSWRNGDLQALDGVMRDSMAEGDDMTLIKTLLWDRNHGMADSLMTLLAKSDTPDTLMVVVGAGHLVGEQSLPSILAERDLTIRSALGHCGDSKESCKF